MQITLILRKDITFTIYFYYVQKISVIALLHIEQTRMKNFKNNNFADIMHFVCVCVCQ